MSIEDAVHNIGERRPGFRPRVAFVLGSGLGQVAERIEAPTRISYAELPGFPVPTVAGHAGSLVLGRLAGVDVLCLNGRVHAYEGGDGAERLKVLVRTVKQSGAEVLVLTNAAGSLRPEVGPGSLVLIRDHINMLGFNPLQGPNDEAWGPRFFSMRDAYDPALAARFHEAARAAGIALPDGVYLAYPGPNFETPAEIRAFRTLGADLVGMSTVPEVLVARHCGLTVAALSAVTNLAEGMSEVTPSHAETLEQGAKIAQSLEKLILAFLESLKHGV
ncbi:purine nucleoside phosphorylase [Aliidongia dinghuensis]|uniref:Purine nucleoside phosphorylase n=1 Tax=Aliidongia dinghuensis TaxID=1867774 RepID=A0A8J3E3U4_9PROT|nr:purine-nucleoside phosphorylase [Aliidongia dinghuensis]GGF21701.1 purine nucleoside phosphorylase [Aliidongia dinghuensis]